MQSPVAATRHPALLIAILIGAGVLCARLGNGSTADWFWAGGVVCLIAIATSASVRRSSVMVTTVLVALLAVTLGGIRYSAVTSNRPNPGVVDLADHERPVELFGEVSGSPQKRLSGWRVPVDLTSVRTRTGTAPLESTVLLTSRRSLDSLRHGDLVRLPARVVLPHVRRNPGGFDYADHLFNKGIDALVRPSGRIIRLDHPDDGFSIHRLVEPARQWLRDVFAEHLPKTPRTLILGFLIGEIGELPPTILNTVRDAGALHLLAVSGANVWLVVGLVLLPLKVLGMPRAPRSVIVLAVVIAFCFLARNEPSVVRASLMVGALLLGSLMRRPIRPLNAVGVAAIIILIHSPTHLFQPGFQLSFAAVISIIAVVGSMRYWKRQPRKRWKRWLLILCASTVAATVSTAPIIAWHFAEVPIVTLPANLLLVPLASVCVYLSIGLLLCDLVWSGLAALVSIPLTLLLKLFLIIAGSFASLPVAVLRWPNPSLLSITIVYGVFVAALNWRHRYRFVRPAVYGLGGIAIVSVAVSFLSDTPPSLKLTLLDAGRAQMAVFNNRQSGQVRLYTDDPHVTFDMREWVVEPFLRHEGLPTDQLAVDAWLTSRADDGSNPFANGARGGLTHHVRYLSDLPKVDRRDRYWADQIEQDGRRATFIRAVPSDTTTTGWRPVLAGESDVLIL
ncbi:MAG: DUF4131 domain-containing protein, partial [candidate division Zixibacteria bacterium]|nr:DUF4131 domain-containing protein [candidate division Zixibacteria bacterium]